MKDELTQLLMKKTGIGEKQAEQAVDVVVDFLADRMPAPFGGALRQFMKDGETRLDPGDIAGALGGLLGGKKDD